MNGAIFITESLKAQDSDRLMTTIVLNLKNCLKYPLSKKENNYSDFK